MHHLLPIILIILCLCVGEIRASAGDKVPKAAVHTKPSASGDSAAHQMTEFNEEEEKKKIQHLFHFCEEEKGKEAIAAADERGKANLDANKKGEKIPAAGSARPQLELGRCCRFIVAQLDANTEKGKGKKADEAKTLEELLDKMKRGSNRMNEHMEKKGSASGKSPPKRPTKADKKMILEAMSCLPVHCTSNTACVGDKEKIKNHKAVKKNLKNLRRPNKGKSALEEGKENEPHKRKRAENNDDDEAKEQKKSKHSAKPKKAVEEDDA